MLEVSIGALEMYSWPIDTAASPLAQDAAAFSALPPRELYQLFGVEGIAADEPDEQPRVSLP